ncbi:MAG: AMP-binding protein, partial [Verrucomicrobia bacterium]
MSETPPAAQPGTATRSFPPEHCIHALFEAHARTAPEAVALTFEKQHLTYGELNAQANRLAHHLRSLGVGPETLVALLAVLKAGGAYVPLDPDSPGERLGLILADAQAPVVLTLSALLAMLGATTATVVCCDRDLAALAPLSAENPAPLA